ncbi:MAG: spermidine/putrescine ABC transporter substrate-binding protein [Halieaceae bacterium]
MSPRRFPRSALTPRLLSACACLLLLVATQLRAETVELYTWHSYWGEEVLGQFEVESGHQLRRSYFDDESVRDAVITSGRYQGFDIVVMDALTLQIVSEHGLFADLSSLNDDIGADNFDPRWRQACGVHGVPYTYGALGMLYRKSVAAEPLRSWRQLFVPPPEHRGRVVMFMDNIDTSAAALLAGGAPPYSEDVAELRQAYGLMRQQQRHLLARNYGLSYASEHGLASQMSLTFGYSSDELELRELTGQEDWTFLIPEEGTLLWADCLAVPSGSPASAATRDFLAFISRPAVAARNAEAIGYATANRSALPLIDESTRGDEQVFLSESILREVPVVPRLTVPAVRLRNRMVHAVVVDAQAGVVAP